MEDGVEMTDTLRTEAGLQSVGVKTLEILWAESSKRERPKIGYGV
jgi:hypothetical protein